MQPHRLCQFAGGNAESAEARSGFSGRRAESGRHGPRWSGSAPPLTESGQILAQRLLTRKVRPDAVYCATDLLACGFMDEARHRFALRIPDDLCIIGHDNIAQSGWASYNLTTFAQPVEQFARDAIAWLVETEAQPETLMPKNEQQQERRIYPVDVVWRGSVRGG
ncbi:HTH-type transcriptional repressor CytR [Pantoea agglomerans]|uniref:HTH-type transcriptional repressor CytR n=1 Tax=Enterobacter agglomerans TaxID=549 RepID=A0A379AG05_ENTAG|nr:HTH-type transcriptional repressor CytR [Pantoea agglomerans]